MLLASVVVHSADTLLVEHVLAHIVSTYNGEEGGFGRRSVGPRVSCLDKVHPDDDNEQD